jgi:hypothetical protein
MGALVIGLVVGVGARTLFAALPMRRSPRSDSSAGEGSAAPPSATSTTLGTDPLSESVFVGGDSLTFTAMWDRGPGDAAPADLTWAAWLGWTGADVQPRLEAAVARGQADSVVVALGTNDSSPTGDDGWTAADVNRFQQLLDTPPATACVVIVLPGYGHGVDPRHAVELDEARADLQALANDRRQAGHGPTVVVDWQPQLDARPQLLAADGIHLATDPATGNVTAQAAAARTGLYWQGLKACASP